MATTAITPVTTAVFGNPLWRNATTTPLANTALPAAIASATPIYKISTTQSAELLLALQSISLTAIITSLQVVITQGTQVTAPNLPTIVSLGVLTNGTYQYTNSRPLTLGVVNTLTFNSKPDGTPWTTADIPNTVIKIIDQSTGGLGNLSSLAVNAISTTIPVATINSITTITSSTPQITWSYSDGDLALQNGYQVQTIDISSNNIVFDSGFILGLDTAYTIPANVTLLNHLIPAVVTFSVISGTSSYAWTSVIASADGSHVYAVASSGGIFTSTNYGATFALIAGTSGYTWTSIACSSDGTKVYAVAANLTNAIFVSTNSGASFVSVANSAGTGFTYVACSTDGTKVFITNQAVWVSLDSGATFTAATGTSGLNFSTVHCSSTGAIVYAGTTTGGFYTSTNTGTSFTSSTVNGTGLSTINDIFCSADGTKIYIAAREATTNIYAIWLSDNSGASFSEESSTVGIPFQDIQGSSDGLTIFAGAYDSTLTSVSGVYSGTYGTITAFLDGGTSTAVATVFYDGGVATTTSWTSTIDAGTSAANEVVFSLDAGTGGSYWDAITSSSDALRVYAGVDGGSLWKYTNSSQYKYQVRVCKTVNGYNNFTSYSSFSPSSTSYSDTVPTVAITTSGNDPLINVTLPDVSALGYTRRDIVILRLWSNGYGVIRNGLITNVGLTAGSVSLIDYENPTNKTVSYAVKAIYYDSSNNEYVGSPVYASVAVPALPSWWIQKCDGLDSGMAIKALLSGGLTLNRTRPQTHMYPLGSRYPITTSGTVQGYDGDLTVYFDNQPAFINFLPYLDYIGKLMISAPNGAYKYITLDKDEVQKSYSRGTDILREMKLSYTEEDSGLGFNEPTVYEF